MKKYKKKSFGVGKTDAPQLAVNIVQNMKAADKQPHLRHSYYAKIVEDQYQLKKLVGAETAVQMIKAVQDSWVD